MRLDVLWIHCVLISTYTIGFTDRGFMARLYPEGSNVALYKPSIQHSTWVEERDNKCTADKAVDGIANNNLERGKSCAHTNGPLPSNVWWEVDLQQQLKIESIKLLNRGQGFHFRLHDVNITVYASNIEPRKAIQCAFDKGNRPGWINLTCDATGRYVRITKPISLGEADQLTLCEVEIYGTLSLQKTMHFKREMHQQVTDDKKLMVKSSLHCATICGNRDCTGYVVKGEQDGSLGCLVVS